MRPPSCSIIPATFLAGAGLGLAALAGNMNLPEQNTASHPLFQVDVATHETRAASQGVSPDANETASEIEAVSSAPATRSTFMASWESISGANGYLLDVSTNSSFSNYVDGFHDLDVGNVTGRVVTGLNPGITYYYRVRAYGHSGPGSYSETATATTTPTTGLTIHPTFDSSITGNPNAAAIEAMINRAIAIYESLFRDPITIQIRFRYATTEPNGTPLPQGILAQSFTAVYMAPWSVYMNALRADAKTSNDNVANASLPGSALSANIMASTANARAVGGNAPPDMFADGTIGPGGPYDGIVTLNSAMPFQFTRPVSMDNFDAQRSVEHEVDEVIGLGSHLNLILPGTDLRPQDLFSWSSPGVRNVTSSGTRYFSINSGTTNIVNINQNPNADLGDWQSTGCPQPHPYVQNAFVCPGQSSDISATSPEGINLDVIGYDLAEMPMVTTNAATNVTSSSATVSGTVNPNGLTTSVHFEYGTSANYGFTTSSHSYTGNTTHSASANITGLSPNTTYHFRIVATNNGGTSYGGDRTCTTLSPTGPPIARTNPATKVASFSTTLNGSVYPHGLTATVYLEYGRTTSYGSTTPPQTRTGNTYHNVSADISGLSASTTYHFRIVASNSAGTRYGADRTFTTLSATGPPVVTTNPAADIANSSARLNGSLDPHGLTTNVHFEYGTTTGYGHNTAMQSRTGNTYRDIAANITTLTRHTTYHFRIVAINSAGTRFGTDRTFTTP